MASQIGVARAMLTESCVVGVKVYGSSPSKFRVIRKVIREARRAAHLWPGEFTGKRSWWVTRFRNQFCRVKRRLVSHWDEGVGKRSQGRIVAIAIRGIPR